jgi:hypothetical protein
MSAATDRAKDRRDFAKLERSALALVQRHGFEVVSAWFQHVAARNLLAHGYSERAVAASFGGYADAVRDGKFPPAPDVYAEAPDWKAKRKATRARKPKRAKRAAR